MENLETIVEELKSIEERMNDLIFDAVRLQLSEGGDEQAKETERKLSKARRSLAKCISTLSQPDADDSGD